MVDFVCYLTNNNLQNNFIIMVHNSVDYLSIFGVVFLAVSAAGLPVLSNIEIPSSTPYRLYTRGEWGADPPTQGRPLSTPVPYVIIHHTYIPAACNTTDQCKKDMKAMQNYHNSLGWGDIGYHFCVGSQGDAYEGRGWNVIGVHAAKANNYSIGICLIGDWRVAQPPQAMLETTKSLIATGVKLGAISKSYKLIGHNQTSATECPGAALTHEISTWEHYEAQPFSVPSSDFELENSRY